MYSIYATFAIVLFGYTAARLAFENSAICWPATSYDEHLKTTRRFDFTPTMKAMILIMIIYYIIDFLRAALMIIYILFHFEICNKIFMIFSFNELLLLVLVIGIPITRHTFPGKLCSGDYPEMWYDANLRIQGEWLYYMTFIVPGYSFFVCWTLHLIATYIASRKRYS